MKIRSNAVIALGSLALFSLGGGTGRHPRSVLAAQRTPVLVELFTSEGCSSCPPADQLLRALDVRQDVSGAQIVVLSEHVDYWNHLGWRDPYSSSVWTERQEEYRGQLHTPEVYTPQAVVDGTHDVVGSDGAALRAQIAAAARVQKLPLTIATAEWRGDRVLAVIAGGPYQGATIYAVLADDRDHSQVAAGENAGRALEHVAVARSLTVVKEGQLQLPAPRGENGHVRLIVFAQAAGGRIVAAAERTL